MVGWVPDAHRRLFLNIYWYADLSTTNDTDKSWMQTKSTRSAGKPRPSPVVLALQEQHLSVHPHHEIGSEILQTLMELDK